MVPSRSVRCLASVFAAFLWIFCSAGALGQQTGANAPAGSPAENTPTRTHKSAPSGGSGSSSNPFPSAQSEAAAKAAAQQNQREQTPPDRSASQPNAPSPSNDDSARKKHAASQANPFPEAQSEAAAKTDKDGNAQAPNAQTQSSSSGSSSSDAHLPPADLGQGRPNSHPRLDSFTRDQTQDGRVQGDLGVADFYMKNGNYRGALSRYQDALRYDSQNDTALYGVAEATCKQNQTADAMALFKTYATSNPQGKYARKAENMLAHPGKCKHNF